LNAQYLARHPGSGQALAHEVCTVPEGKVVRVRLFGSWEEALEAAGLRG
jgi:hypothetical protein